MITVFSAIFFYYGSLTLGAVFYIVGYFFDSVDGKLARLRGVASPKGAFLDGLVDTFRPFVLTLGLGIFIYAKTNIWIFVIAISYVVMILAYQTFCATGYNLNKGKQIMVKLTEENPSSFLSIIKLKLKKHRLRLGFTTAETNCLAFFIGPLLGNLNLVFIIYGYLFALILISLLTLVFLYLQIKSLK